MNRMKLTRGERFKDARTVFNQHGHQTLREVQKATGVVTTAIQALETDENKRGVSYQTVAILAKHYGVSTDYLLSLSDVPKVDEKITASCEVTGFSYDAIMQLVQLNNDFGYAPLLSALIESSHFAEVLHKIYGALWCKKSPAQREVENWSKLGKDLFVECKGQEISSTIQEVLRVYSRYSDDFVIVPRLSQSISYLQEAQKEIMEAAEEAIQKVENNHSMDDVLLMAAKMELRAICGNGEGSGGVDNG